MSRPRRAFTGALLALALAPLAPAAAAPARAVDPPAPPPAIPALQQWSAAPGSPFTLTSTPHVVVSAPVGLPTADVLAEDLTAATGVTHDAVVGRPVPGDIALNLSAESALGNEGYHLEIGPVAEVSAPTDAGLFYGGQSLVQMLHQQHSLPAGVARDWPRYPQRGLMLDMGRHHFDLAFLKRQVRETAYLKLNLLHLHLSDDVGFRIESTRHPEITSPDHLTKAEVRSLVAFAAERHITVVPEIDMPGHMGAILAKHPELQLANALGARDPSRLDVTDPAARSFAQDIIDEFVPLFPGRYWHLGADEYMPTADYLLHPSLTTYAKERFGLRANAKDAVLGFVNEMAAHLEAGGKTVRVWNDELGGGSAVTPDPHLVVEWWTGFSPLGGDVLPAAPQQLIDSGHAVLNNGWWPTYDAEVGLPKPDMAVAYDEWRVHRFHSSLYLSSTIKPPPYLVAPDEQRNLGTKLAVWMDTDRSDAAVEASLLPRLQVIAQKAWESPQPPTYDLFLAIAEDVGRAP